MLRSPRQARDVVVVVDGDDAAEVTVTAPSTKLSLKQ